MSDSDAKLIETIRRRVETSRARGLLDTVAHRALPGAFFAALALPSLTTVLKGNLINRIAVYGLRTYGDVVGGES